MQCMMNRMNRNFTINYSKNYGTFRNEDEDIQGEPKFEFKVIKYYNEHIITYRY